MIVKITSIGKRIIPPSLLPYATRAFGHIINLYYLQKGRKLSKEIIAYYSKCDNNVEISDVIKYLKVNGFSIFPYEWGNESNQEYISKLKSVQVFHDEKLNLPYVCFNQKRLYYPREMDARTIQKSFCGEQLIAQNPQSPHRYLTDHFCVESGDIVVDCGVAEGNFGVSIVDTVSKLYLFEPDEKWMEPLHATFAPWNDKVIIIQKYLSNITDEANISLDDYFQDKEYPNFIKLDVEGYEERLLHGAYNILSSSDLKKVVVCTYHKQGDEETLGALLRLQGYNVIASQGYMLFIYDKNFNPPYLRRGVLRATK